ncbi:MAG TPA: hypothetical protein VFY57_03865, partial [Rubrobacteraceae bacterium]|nr:hypothetical protein [Rubrobacteraceae bacterium]
IHRRGTAAARAGSRTVAQATLDTGGLKALPLRLVATIRDPVAELVLVTLDLDAQFYRLPVRQRFQLAAGERPHLQGDEPPY